MKDFLYQLEITLSSIALPHRILHSDVLNFSICLLMWENRWVEKDTFVGKKNSHLQHSYFEIPYLGSLVQYNSSFTQWGESFCR